MTNPTKEIVWIAGLSEMGSEEYALELGHKYLVFAHVERDILTTPICSGNRAGDQAAADEELLDQLVSAF